MASASWKSLCSPSLGFEGVVSRKLSCPPTKPKEELVCPRCSSSRTKFCYYNNYSLTQPRYFCKTCRRYWTEGGSLRNVPVGGGIRKNKKKSLPPSSSSISNLTHGRNSRNISQLSSCCSNPCSVHRFQNHSLRYPLFVHNNSSQVLEMINSGFIPPTKGDFDPLGSYNSQMRDPNISLSNTADNLRKWYDLHETTKGMQK